MLYGVKKDRRKPMVQGFGGLQWHCDKNMCSYEEKEIDLVRQYVVGKDVQPTLLVSIDENKYCYLEKGGSG